MTQSKTGEIAMDEYTVFLVFIIAYLIVEVIHLRFRVGNLEEKEHRNG